MQKNVGRGGGEGEGWVALKFWNPLKDYGHFKEVSHQTHTSQSHSKY